MQFTTQYREESAGNLSAAKNFFLICKVEFSNEELAVIQERGLADLRIEAPPQLPMPPGSILPTVLTVLGYVVLPVGFIVGCTAKMTMGFGGTEGGYLTGIAVFFIGVALFVTARFMKASRHAEQIKAFETQKLSLGTLILQPTFTVYAPTLDMARKHEQTVRDELAAMAKRIRDNIVVPEQNTYEL